MDLFRPPYPAFIHAFGRIQTRSHCSNYRILSIDHNRNLFYFACPNEICHFERLSHCHQFDDCFRCWSCGSFVPDDCYIIGMILKGWARQAAAHPGGARHHPFPITIGSTALSSIGLQLPFKFKMADPKEAVVATWFPVVQEEHEATICFARDPLQRLADGTFDLRLEGIGVRHIFEW